MITLHAFANMFPGGIGETKDIRIQWALEEMGLSYEVRALDYLGGEADGPDFSAISPFNQIPVLEDDGLVIAESCAILIHLAEKSGRLMPSDEAGRLRVIQWCFAATATVAPALSMIAMFDAGFMGKDPAAREFLVGIAMRWLAGLERQLEGHDWITGDDFTIADLTLADVLREIRETDLMDGYPGVRAFYARAFARPARDRARALTAARMGVDLKDIA
ncbi:MAG: glutathione S-transferase family protein [Brevundimonas sp.]|uniref:glutathione S-transferase family protein n=1 Tax=Brevundimonas sp. TaxID=1871086 RepID=UPI0027368A55|nr:glutathione S-transferase family protein [Brevundimonas sp.]MDP3656579.1 glutathione S-transferase family protein [Brevundimonas sp.]